MTGDDTSVDRPAFDLLGSLPEGTTVLEASAGTGKTYAIVGLATRYVAEGVAEVSDLLLVTFSRAATQELRERTRERFAAVAGALAGPVAAQASSDELIRHLGTGEPADVELRRRRLRRALSDFDAGTIATTHSFCQRMLDSLGIAGEREPDASFVEVVDEVVNEVVDDLFLQRYARERTPPMSLRTARDIARVATADRQARLVPDPDPQTEAGHRAAFAGAVRSEVQRRKRNKGIRDFDDLLVLLHDVLVDPVHGRAACERIASRYRVVLVDEFQDTDPLQWEILRRAFHGSSTLVLVGDPKQAIYGFRGAEVLSYLDAVRHADSYRELSSNRRSDPGLLQALEYLYGGASLGHEQIVVHPVEAHHRTSRMPGHPPLRLRHLPRTGAGALNKSGFPAVGRQRDRVAADVAADLVRLLGSGASLRIDDVVRQVQPGDIAVLVRTRAQIATVRAALDRAGVPSVLAGGSSVFDTASARHWLAVLRALEQPHRPDRVRFAALTPLIGWTAAALDDAADGIAPLGSQLRELAVVFGNSGFAAVFERIAADTGLERRLLGRDAGERDLTDLRHLSQLLNRVAVQESLGLTALARWLAEHIADPSSGSISERSRRLDSDAAAVQIATVHASKGLEFPIVYLPYSWDVAKQPYPTTLLLHDAAGARILDVGGQSGPGYGDRKRRNEIEDAGEELRLLYVALTRAQCQVVLWWAPTITTAGSPLHRFVLGRPPGSPGIPGRARVPADSVVAADLAEWGTGAAEVVSVEAVGPAEIVVGQLSFDAAPDRELAVATFDRVLDFQWRRTSYSALTTAVHESPGVFSETEHPGKDDEPAEPPLDVAVAPRGPASSMNDLPAGAAFGTLVHEVLEALDTGSVDLDVELRMRCTDAVAARGADVDPRHLADALAPVLNTPLGDGTTLARIPPADRLAELEFEFPLAGGDHPTADELTLSRVCDLLRAGLPASDVLAGYPDELAAVGPAPLRGYLTGSIDAVLRSPTGRFVVVDYKTNRLGTGELTVGHYTRARMATEMRRAHYPLQALLYSVALHRYLRWRLPGYQPDRHLGGMRYLFVRGMIGPETPAGCGVFDWDPPPALTVGLSDLLAGIPVGIGSGVR